MSDSKFIVVDKIGSDNVLAFKTKASVAIDLDDDIIKFHDLNYSFEEVLSIARKIEQIQDN